MKRQQGFITYIILFLIIIATVASLLIFIKGGEDRRNNKVSDEVYLDSDKDPQVIKELITKVNTHEGLKDIISRCKKANPAINLNKFGFIGKEASLDEKRTPNYIAEEDSPRWLFSPDKSQAISWLIDYGQPDSSLYLYGRNSKYTLLKNCGTPCQYWGGVWLDNNEFAFISTVVNETKSKTTNLFVLNFYNTIDNTVTTYNQVLKTEPKIIFYKDWNTRLEKLKK